MGTTPNGQGPVAQIQDSARARIRAAMESAGDLRLHIVSAHANLAGLTLSEDEALDYHDHEHAGPGTIRDHDREALFFDPQQVEESILGEVLAAEPDDLLAGVDRMVRQPSVLVTMGPGEHAHEAPGDSPWQVCPAGAACGVYPRFVDLTGAQTPDGEFRLSAFQRVERVEDDISRGIREALAALDLAEAKAVSSTDPAEWPLAETLGAAAARLRHALRLAYPLLFPEHAAERGSLPPAAGTGRDEDAE